MKTNLVSLIVAALCLHPLFALPPDAEALKAKRDAKVAEIDRIYATELEKLQKKAMADGNLAGANEIEKEIAAVVKDPFDLESALLTRKWNYTVTGGKSSVIEIRRDKTAVDAKTGSAFWKSWKVRNKTTLDCIYPDGNTCQFQFDAQNFDEARGVTNNGAERILKAD